MARKQQQERWRDRFAEYLRRRRGKERPVVDASEAQANATGFLEIHESELSDRTDRLQSTQGAQGRSLGLEEESALHALLDRCRRIDPENVLAGISDEQSQHLFRVLSKCGSSLNHYVRMVGLYNARGELPHGADIDAHVVTLLSDMNILHARLKAAQSSKQPDAKKINDIETTLRVYEESSAAKYKELQSVQPYEDARSALRAELERRLKPFFVKDIVQHIAYRQLEKESMEYVDAVLKLMKQYDFTSELAKEAVESVLVEEEPRIRVHRANQLGLTHLCDAFDGLWEEACVPHLIGAKQSQVKYQETVIADEVLKHLLEGNHEFDGALARIKEDLASIAIPEGRKMSVLSANRVATRVRNEILSHLMFDDKPWLEQYGLGALSFRFHQALKAIASDMHQDAFAQDVESKANLPYVHEIITHLLNYTRDTVVNHGVKELSHSLGIPDISANDTDFDPLADPPAEKPTNQVKARQVELMRVGDDRITDAQKARGGK